MPKGLGIGLGLIEAFMGWWFRELASLAPRWWRRAPGHARRAPVLVLGLTDAKLMEPTADGASRTLRTVVVAASTECDQHLSVTLRPARSGRRPLIVRLSRDLGLRKILDLPLVAENDLDQLLRFEMERLTPFRENEVVFAQRVLGRDLQNRRISVELHVAPKHVVERALKASRALGFVPARIELADTRPPGDGTLNLLPEKHRETAKKSWSSRVPALLGVALFAGAVLIPIQRQRAILVDLEARVATARAGATEALALRESLDQLTASAGLLADKARRPMAIEVVTELTRLVPDQAHITELVLRDGTIQLYGYASTASDLIRTLGQSPLFRNPQFDSAVTLDPQTGIERFHISVQPTANRDS